MKDYVKLCDHNGLSSLALLRSRKTIVPRSTVQPLNPRVQFILEYQKCIQCHGCAKDNPKPLRSKRAQPLGVLISHSLPVMK